MKPCTDTTHSAPSHGTGSFAKERLTTMAERSILEGWLVTMALAAGVLIVSLSVFYRLVVPIPGAVCATSLIAG